VKIFRACRFPLLPFDLAVEAQNAKGDVMQRITPFLWFDNNAEEAANFYVSIFKNSRILSVTRYGDAGPGPKGTVMTAEFELDGQKFIALNAGPRFKFTEAISFVVNCETQKEIDYFWEKLSAGGEESQCGWLKDKYGLSWQVVPTILGELMGGKDPKRSNRVMQALLQMQKLEIEPLKRAYEGE
jgi:predicted 3-demethylubiquinone-9 3-methyltransferase (glyoxalase superfamily)